MNCNPFILSYLRPAMLWSDLEGVSRYVKDKYASMIYLVFQQWLGPATGSSSSSSSSSNSKPGGSIRSKFTTKFWRAVAMWFLLRELKRLVCIRVTLWGVYMNKLLTLPMQWVSFGSGVETFCGTRYDSPWFQVLRGTFRIFCVGCRWVCQSCACLW